MALEIMEQLAHSTVRIDCTLTNGNTSCGTGFYVNFLQDGARAFPVIITNKHVIDGASVGRIHVTFADENGNPISGSHEQFSIENFESQWIKHPNPSIDLAALPIGALLNAIKGKTPFYVPLSTELIATQAERESYGLMEDIVMIGYPNTIWDEVNNLPIVRRGVTATHVKTKWNGRDEFLTDVASFPGSSGSPVFLCNLGSFTDTRGNVFAGRSRVKLLGVHFAGFLHRADGTIEVATAPTSARPVPVTMVPNNLGIVVNALRILDLEKIVRDRLKPTFKHGASLAVTSVNYGAMHVKKNTG